MFRFVGGTSVRTPLHRWWRNGDILCALTTGTYIILLQFTCSSPKETVLKLKHVFKNHTISVQDKDIKQKLSLSYDFVHNSFWVAVMMASMCCHIMIYWISWPEKEARCAMNCKWKYSITCDVLGVSVLLWSTSPCSCRLPGGSSRRSPGGSGCRSSPCSGTPGATHPTGRWTCSSCTPG